MCSRASQTVSPKVEPLQQEYLLDFLSADAQRASTAAKRGVCYQIDPPKLNSFEHFEFTTFCMLNKRLDDKVPCSCIHVCLLVNIN